MSRKSIVFITLLLMYLNFFNATGQTRLGLHFTLEEINIWKERAAKGPYKSTGDVSPNTPGDWDRIVRNKNTFVSNPSAGRWSGPPGTGCVVVNNSQKDGVDVPNKPVVGKMQDAAFYALLFNDSYIKNLVKTELLWQATQTGVDFTNRNRWCGKISDNSPNFEIAIWGCILLYTYEYVEDAFTDTEKKVFLDWINGFASYLQDELDPPLDRLFKNRGAAKIEDYVYIGSTTPGELVYAGGYNTIAVQKYYNNRRAHMMQLVGEVGIKLNNDSYVTSAKNFIRETLAFMCFPDGAFGELHRSIQSLPSKGLNYLTNTFGAMIMVADALARKGDFSMYDFKTSFGIGDTKGTTEKSLEWAITEHGKYLDGQKKVYAKEGTIGDSYYQIDGTHSDWIMMNDATNFAIANMYYKNAYNKSVYMRTAPGIYPYPTATLLASNGTTLAWKGLVGHTAGLFMYGQMEGKVWPYPGSSAPTANKIPVVSAGVDVKAQLPLSGLKINGQASDSDGSIASYLWTKVSGPSIVMSNTSTASLSLSSISAGSYVFKLKATDNDGASASDDVAVTIAAANKIPVVSAGVDVKAQLPLSSLKINGQASDSDGSITSYLWTKVSGPSVVMSNTSTASLSLSSISAGSYVFKLKATDNDGASASDDVAVTIAAANKIPVVSAGVDVKAQLPLSSLKINGQASDSDGSIASYLWTKVSGPSVVMSNTSTASLSLSSISAGSYVFKLKATDNDGASASDDVVVTIEAANKIPVVSAGVDVKAQLPLSSLKINGQASDSDGSIASYLWTKVSGPSVVMSNTSTASLSLSSISAGSYVFKLKATDNDGASASDDVAVTIAAANKIPVVSAGVDVKAQLPLSGLKINGQASDSDGSITSYLWTKVSGPSVVMSNTSTASLSLSSISAGSYVFKLKATDNDGASASDDVAVTIAAAVITYPTETSIENTPTDTVIASPALSVSLTSSDVTCHGEANGAASVTVQGGKSPYVYSWSNGATGSSIGELAPGDYFVTVTDQLKSSQKISFSILENPAIAISYELKQPSNLSNQGAIDVSVLGGEKPYTYLWSNGEETEDISGLPAGDYTLTVTDQKGCSKSTTISLLLQKPIQKEEPILAYHPRSFFSPNGDGSGDELWTIDNVEAINGCRLIIFSEEGRKVYETVSYQNNWDGRINGSDAPAGGYYYVIVCPESRGSTKGTFRLIR